MLETKVMASVNNSESAHFRNSERVAKADVSKKRPFTKPQG
jgi:hypothetical protein